LLRQRITFRAIQLTVGATSSIQKSFEIHVFVSESERKKIAKCIFFASGEIVKFKVAQTVFVVAYKVAGHGTADKMRYYDVRIFVILLF
jgi:hypothetical protein